MANQEVLFKLKIVQEGQSLKVIADGADKAAKSTKKLGQEQKKQQRTQSALNKQKDKTNKMDKSLYQSNLSSAKGFSKQNQMLEGGGGSSGLVQAYATLAANVFAATAAFAALQRAAQVQQLIEGLEAVGEASGKNLKLLAGGIRDAAGGAIALEQALQTASVGASAGFDSSQIQGLAEVAKSAALALGRDVGDAVDRLTRGAAKLEPEILDELGIFVRLDDASEKYAASLGVAASELTRFQQRQAFANEIIDQGTRKFSVIGESVDVDPFNQLAATMADLSRNVMDFFNTVLGPIAGFFANNTVALAGFFAVITKGILNQALPVLSQFAERSRQAALQEIQRAKVQQIRAQKEIKNLTAVLQPLKKSKAEYNNLFKAIKNGDTSMKTLEAAEKSLMKSIKARQNALTRGSKATLAARKKEIELAKEQLRTVRQLKDAEQRRAGTAGNIATLTAGARAKRSEQAVFRELDKDPSFKGHMRAFGLANLATKKYEARLQKAGVQQTLFGIKSKTMTKALNLSRVAFFKFGLTAKIAIKGIFTAIPVIGQLLLVLDLLISALKSFVGFLASFKREATAAEKAQKALNDQLVFYNEVQGQGSKVAETQSQQLKVTANATSGLIDAMKENSAAQQESFDKANNFGKVLIALGEKFDKFGRKIKNFFEPISNSIGKFFEFFEIKMLEIQRKYAFFINLLIRGINAISGEGRQLELIDVSDIDAQIEGIRRARVELEKFRERQTTNASLNLLSSATIASSEFQSLEQVLLGVGKASQELNDFLGTNNMNTFIQQISAAKAAIEASGGATDDIGETFATIFGPNLDGIAERFIKTSASGEKFLDVAGFIGAVLEQGTAQTVSSGKAIEELENTFTNSGEKINTFFNNFKKNSKLTASISEFENIETLFNEINEAAEFGGATAVAEQFENATPKLLAFLDNGKEVKKVQQQIADGTISQEDAVEALGQARLKELKNMNEVNKALFIAEMIDASRLSLLKRQINAVKKAGTNNAAAAKTNILLSNAQNQIQINNLENENKLKEQNLGLTKGQVLSQEEINKLSLQDAQAYGQLLDNREKQAGLQEKIVGEAEKEALIAKAGFKLKQMSLQNAREVLATEQKVLETTQRRANAERGIGRTRNAVETLKAEQAAAKLKTKEIQDQIDLLELRREFEVAILKARLKAAGIAETEREDILSDLNDMLDMEKSILGEKKKQSLEDEKNVGNNRITGLLTNTTAFQMGAAIDEGVADMTVDGAGIQEKLEGLSEATKPLRDQLIALGPEGELVAIAQQGILTMASAFDVFYKNAEPGDRLAAVGAAIGAVSQIMAANSKAQISELDRQIEAEKKRDGKSAESLNKIKAMEKKKEQMAKKAFDQSKKMNMAMTVVNTAAAVVKTLNDPTIPDTFTRTALAVMIGGLGAAQLAIIAKQKFEGSSASIEKPKASLTIGKRSSNVDVSQRATAGELTYLRGGRTTGQDLGGAGAAMGRKGYAMGFRRGYADGGVVVGERGPEVISPSNGVDITPNFALGGGETNVNFTINAVDAAGVEDVLRNQQGNIIRMIREAANENGERFLETVDTQTYGSSV